METRNKRLLIDELHYHSIKDRFYPNDSELDLLIHYILERKSQLDEISNSFDFQSKYINYSLTNPEENRGIILDVIEKSIAESKLDLMFRKDFLSIVHYFAILISAKALGFINVDKVEEFLKVDQFIYKLISSDVLFIKESLNILPSQLFLLVYESNIISKDTEDIVLNVTELKELHYEKIDYSISNAYRLVKEYSEYPTNSAIIGAFMGDLLGFESVLKNSSINYFISVVQKNDLYYFENSDFTDYIDTIDPETIVEGSIGSSLSSTFLSGFVAYLHYIDQLYTTLNERSDKPLFKLIVWSLNSYLYRSDNEFCLKIQSIINRLLIMNSRSYEELYWGPRFIDYSLSQEDFDNILMEIKEREQNLLLKTNYILAELESVRFIYDTSPANSY